MKIVVFGASQGIGYQLLRLTVESQHDVTAVLRDPTKLNMSATNLTIVKGDIRDSFSVGRAVEGQDAVCICVGIPPTRKPVDVFSTGTANVLGAMADHPSQKLVVVTGIGAGDSKGHGGFFYDYIINPLLLGTIYTDKNRAEALIRASKVPWLIVRPGFLTNGSRTGTYRVIDDLSGVVAGKIARADVADFMLKQLATPTHFGKTPLLTY